MAKSKTIKSINDLKPQVRNTNKHTQRGLGLLQDSIQANGWIGAITVAADGESFDGSARIEVGADAGFNDAIVVRSDGSKPVIHIREDIKTADDPKAKLLGIAANRIAEIDFDPDAKVLASLADDGIEFGNLYSDDELQKLLQDNKSEYDFLTEDGNEDSESGGGGEAGASADAFYPLSIVLTRQDKNRWDKYKESIGVKVDGAAFARLLDEVNQ